LEQRQIISEYNKTREQFNPVLFERKTQNLIDQVLKVIKSVERDGQFIFKLHSYRLVTNYAEVHQLLIDYENNLKKGKNKNKINSYEYVNLKDSDVILLIVDFYIKIKDEEMINTIYICIPIYVNKYYFRISGNYYLPNLQIVDGSTFNSTTSKTAISDSVILKTILMSIKTYRNSYKKEDNKGLMTTDEELITTNYFSMTAFNKTFSPFKYILAKFGLYETLKFMNFQFIRIDKEDPNFADYYTFKTGKVYLSCPKHLFNSDNVVQSFICTLHMAFNKKGKYHDLFTKEYWLESLGGEWGKSSAKGSSLIESIEGIYDKATYEAIHLPEKYKCSVYHILRWMISEFDLLMQRDNLNLETKRVRLEEYIASLYGMKIANIVQKFTDAGTNNLDMKLATKYMRGLKPTYLIDNMIQCRFINCKNSVNDIDTWQVIKYTMNNLPGMDEKVKKDSKLPTVYKPVHYSQLGRLDSDSSPKSAPGIAGTLTAFCHIEKDGNFTNYEEPITWDDKFNELMSNYKQSIGMKESFMVREKLLGNDSLQSQIIDADNNINMYECVVKPIVELQMSKQYTPEIIPLEPGGIIYYQR